MSTDTCTEAPAEPAVKLIGLAHAECRASSREHGFKRDLAVLFGQAAETATVLRRNTAVTYDLGAVVAIALPGGPIVGADHVTVERAYVQGGIEAPGAAEDETTVYAYARPLGADNQIEQRITPQRVMLPESVADALEAATTITEPTDTVSGQTISGATFYIDYGSPTPMADLAARLRDAKGPCGSRCRP